jgi:hypothetical protein
VTKLPEAVDEQRLAWANGTSLPAERTPPGVRTSRAHFEAVGVKEPCLARTHSIVPLY